MRSPPVAAPPAQVSQARDLAQFGCFATDLDVGLCGVFVCFGGIDEAKDAKVPKHVLDIT